ncbi:conserved lipothrixviral protein [Sulfolobus islandicus filamentous virus 2]|uniref:Conserved lipothrixviral protein n=1 Tax=Sulfolobus islandicus filamentous virus 2 TaxID=1902331 RepID=A0A1D8BJ99_SIFV|nr:conserved lipothrixviral protein [Sulfolobus islandicus filamentous virus 2]
MRVVTFVGNSTYLDEVIFKNKVTDLYVDRSYVYKLGSRWQGVPDSLLPEDTIFLNLSDIEKFRSYDIHVVVSDTGIKYGDGEREVMNRRLRIAKMITTILNDIHDDILFVDSDVILNENVFNQISSSTSAMPMPICIPALMKPSTFIVFIFCYSTNFYLPSSLHDKLYDAMKMYIDKQLYVSQPVDLYIHNSVLDTRKIILERGVCHYIRGNVYCI